MRGKVEVFAIAADGSQELLVSEDNLVVNGAGESIVDMLTMPSSVLGFAPRVMDTSNWRFGAISFAPPAAAFSGNAYFFPKDKVYMKDGDLCNGVSANVASLIDTISTDHKLRVLWVSSTTPGLATWHSYTPPYRLPSYPDPVDYKLADASTDYCIVSGDGTQSFGQFENRINFAPTDGSSYFQGAYPRKADNSEGDFPPLSGMLISSYEGVFADNASANMIIYNEEYSEYNEHNNMDYRGFISTKYNVTNTQDLLGHCYVSGHSSNTLTGPASQAEHPVATISTLVSKGDVWALNLYGGIHQIGLWNMDTLRALDTTTGLGTSGAPLMVGNNFIDQTTGITPQEYKLFAKKSFTNNLATIQDDGNTAGFTNHLALKISWTMDFRTGGNRGLAH
jgi:hypothetical protein